MQTAEALISHLRRRGVQIEPEGDGLAVYPRSRLTDLDRQAIRALKLELLALLKNPSGASAAVSLAPSGERESDAGEKALALVARLRGFTLPADRMPVAREMAQRLHGLIHPAAILNALRAFESEVAAIGGRYDPELAASVLMVETAFPGAWLVKITQHVH